MNINNSTTALPLSSARKPEFKLVSVKRDGTWRFGASTVLPRTVCPPSLIVNIDGLGYVPIALSDDKVTFMTLSSEGEEEKVEMEFNLDDKEWNGLTLSRLVGVRTSPGGVEIAIRGTGNSRVVNLELSRRFEIRLVFAKIRNDTALSVPSDKIDTLIDLFARGQRDVMEKLASIQLNIREQGDRLATLESKVDAMTK